MSGEQNKLQKKLQVNGDAFVTVNKVPVLTEHCQAM